MKSARTPFWIDSSAGERMEPGTTFLPDAGGSHLWVVISDPKLDSERVVIVSLTTERNYKDNSCVLQRGTHPWITHTTCVDYRRARVVKLEELKAGRYAGALKLQEAASPAMLHAIRDGASRSEFLPGNALQVLTDQGIVAPPETPDEE